MKKAVIAASLAAVMSMSAQADTIFGLYVGGNVWQTETSGSFGEELDQLSTFKYEDEDNSNFYVALEHPIPLLPNIRVVKNEFATTGDATLTNDFDFGGGEFGTGDVVGSGFDVDFIDYTLYYEIFDNGLFSFDVGLTARDFDGDVDVTLIESASTTSTDAGTLSVSEIAPMLYTAVELGIPATDLSLFASGNFLSFDDHSMYDIEAGVSYALLDNLAVDLNLNVGYRVVKLELEDLDDLYTDLEFEGVFAGATLHF